MVVPWVVSEELWERIEPLLPVRPAARTGPKPLPDRAVLQGILFVLYTGIGGEDLPQELGFGSGMTCWRRLRDWQEAGVFAKLHEVLLAELNAAAAIDWSRACVGASHVRAKKGGPDTGPSPVDRGKTGSKHHLICDGGGIPLAVTLTGGNRNDITQLIPLLEAIPPVRGRRGRPRRKPDALVADRGDDHDRDRDLLQRRGIRPLISRRGTRDNNQTVRWGVEQTLALLHQFRRLATHWERRTDIHHGFLALATSLIYWRRLTKTTCQELLMRGAGFVASRPDSGPVLGPSLYLPAKHLHTREIAAACGSASSTSCSRTNTPAPDQSAITASMSYRSRTQLLRQLLLPALV